MHYDVLKKKKTLWHVELPVHLLVFQQNNHMRMLPVPLREGSAILPNKTHQLLTHVDHFKRHIFMNFKNLISVWSSLNNASWSSLNNADALSKTLLSSYWKYTWRYLNGQFKQTSHHKLKSVLEDNNFVNSPGQIYNVDKSGMPLNHSIPKVITQKGHSKVNSWTTGDKSNMFLNTFSPCHALTVHGPIQCMVTLMCIYGT